MQATARSKSMSAGKSFCLTLPDVAAEIGLKVDRLRHLLRRHDEVRALFQRAGSSWVLPTSMVPELRRKLADVSPTSSSSCAKPCSSPTD